MSHYFDLLLGEDWCETTSCEIASKIRSLKHDDADGRCHTLLTQATDGPHVNAVDSDIMMVPNDAKLQSVLDSYKDHFPTELPSTLHPPAT